MGILIMSKNWYFAVVLIFLCNLISTVVFAQSVAIKAGHLILPDSEKVLDNQTLIIEDGKITRIGRNLDTSGMDKVVNLPDS